MILCNYKFFTNYELRKIVWKYNEKTKCLSRNLEFVIQ
jgi:hypothetical protein